MLDDVPPASQDSPQVSRASFRRWLYLLLEAGDGETWLSWAVDWLLILVILANVAGFVLETVPSVGAHWHTELRWLEVGSLLIFTLEYAARLWAAPEIPFYSRMPAWQARWSFARRGPMLIDFITIAPFWLSAFVLLDLRILRVFRLFRLLKLNRYSPAMHTLMRVLSNERKALGGALLLVLIALLFAASGMYLIEGHAQPDTFGSIPQSAWWAIVTLTTVGYGDVTPVTALGKVFAGIVMLCGLIVLALPIAIISTGFAQEVNRRDFVLTWSMLAKIPFFAEFDAPAVGAILGYLKAHNLPANREVVASDPHGRSMYFVASGLVEDAGSGLVFKTGEYFGEHSILNHGARPAAYVTRERTRLLELSHADFLKLQGHYPHVWKHFRSGRPITKPDRN